MEIQRLTLDVHSVAALVPMDLNIGPTITNRLFLLIFMKNPNLYPLVRRPAEADFWLPQTASFDKFRHATDKRRRQMHTVHPAD